MERNGTTFLPFFQPGQYADLLCSNMFAQCLNVTTLPAVASRLLCNMRQVLSVFNLKEEWNATRYQERRAIPQTTIFGTVKFPSADLKRRWFWRLHSTWTALQRLQAVMFTSSCDRGFAFALWGRQAPQFLPCWLATLLRVIHESPMNEMLLLHVAPHLMAGGTDLNTKGTETCLWKSYSLNICISYLVHVVANVVGRTNYNAC
jgi:hypothetical protein